MTDMCLSAPDQATMYAAYQATGIMDAEGNITTQGRFEDGTDWAIVDWGMVDGLYWCVMRWNGDHPLPADQPGVTVAWSSAVEDPGPYPEGLPRFA